MFLFFRPLLFLYPFCCRFSRQPAGCQVRLRGVKLHNKEGRLPARSTSPGERHRRCAKYNNRNQHRMAAACAYNSSVLQREAAQFTRTGENAVPLLLGTACTAAMLPLLPRLTDHGSKAKKRGSARAATSTCASSAAAAQHTERDQRRRAGRAPTSTDLTTIQE